MSVRHSEGEIRCQFVILRKSGGKSGVSSSFLPEKMGKSGVSSSFLPEKINRILARKDKPTPDYVRKDEPTPDYVPDTGLRAASGRRAHQRCNGEIRCQFVILGKSGVSSSFLGNPVSVRHSWEIRYQFVILGKSGISSSFLGKSGVSSSLLPEKINRILARKDKPTPDYVDTGLRAASGRRAHERCNVDGCPWRIDFARGVFRDNRDREVHLGQRLAFLGNHGFPIWRSAHWTTASAMRRARR